MLTTEQIKEYHVKGFVLLREFISLEDVMRLLAEADRLWPTMDASGKDSGVQWRNHVTRGRVPDRFDPIADRSKLFADLLYDRRFLDGAADVLGGPTTPFKNKLIYKWPGTHGYKLHQDAPYYNPLNLPGEAMLAFMVALDPATPENGALEIWEGLHTRGTWPHPTLVGKLKALPGYLTRRRIFSMQSGDALLFNSMTPHRSGINRSSRPRRALFYSYTLASFGNAQKHYYDTYVMPHTLRKNDDE